jgi:hypothetical protein
LIIVAAGAIGAGVAVALVLFAVVAAVAYLAQLGKHAEAREQVKAAVLGLTAEFPDEVRSWGGDSVLRHADTARQVARRLGVAPAEEQPVAVVQEALAALESGPLAVEPEQRRPLAGQLRQVLERQEEVARLGEPRRFAWPTALAFGLLLGVVVGMGLGGMYLGYAGPHRYFNAYFDSGGWVLDAGQYALRQRRANLVAAVIGIGGGLLALGAGYWLARWRWYRLPLAVGVGVGLALGGVTGAGLGALYDGLWGPYTVSGRYYDHRGQEVLREVHALHVRKAMTTAALVGVGAGLLVLLATAAVVLARFRVQRRHARARMAGQVAEVVKAFPQAVQTWGGPAALQRRETVQAMLRAMESGGGAR